MKFFSQKKITFLVPFFLILVAIAFFYKFFIYKLVSIPGDITVGMYYPWLDQQWSGLQTNVPVKNPLMSDIVSIIYQWRILSIDSLKQGIFPFWTNQYLLGVPLFANFQNSLFNITNLWFFIISNNGVAWTLMVFSQLIFSLLSSYFCLRTFKFKPLSSIIGSIIFSFSLFNIVWLEYGIHTYIAAFLPLMFVCIEKFFQKNKMRYLVFLSFLIALQFYGGYPQYSIFSLGLIFIYFISFSKKPFIKKTFQISIFIILGLIICLPLLIPGFELIQRSIRNIDVTSQDKTLGFLPFNNFLTFPIPNFWGNPTTYDYYGIGYYDNNAIFPGSLAIIAFFFVLLENKKRRKFSKINFFIFTIIFCFLIVIKNPFSLLLKNNLGFIFSGNGISTRIFILANFAFSIITAYFIDKIILTKDKKINLSLFIPIFWQIIIFLFILVKKNNYFPIASKNTFYALGLSFIILSAILIIQKSKSVFIRKISLGILLMLIIGESFYYGLKYLPFAKNDYLFPQTPELEFLQQNSNNYRISTTNTIPANMWVPYRLSSADGYDTTMPLLNFEYFSLLQTGDFSPVAQRAIKMDNEKSSLYQNLSIKYKLTLGNEAPIKSSQTKNQFFTVFHQKNTIVQENKNVLSPIRFVDQIVFVSDKNEFKDIYQNIDFSKTAVLYNSDKDKIKNFDNNCSSQLSSLSLIKNNNNSVEFITQNNCPRLVFISNSFYPGWKATIDNQPVDIYQTNFVFQGVFIPSGEHQIKLNYYPSNFNLYIYLSLFSAIILLSILTYDFRKK